MQLLLFLFTLYSVLGCRFAVRSGEKIKPPDQGKRKIEDQSKTSKTNQEIKPPDLRKRGETEVTNKAKIREIYAAVCLRIGQIRMGLAQLKNSDFLKPCVSGFSRVLMTIDIFIFNVDLQLVPDDVTSKTPTMHRWPKRVCLSSSASSRTPTTQIETLFWQGSNTRKSVFDVTSSGNKLEVDIKNEDVYRHQHPREPRNTRNTRKSVFDVTSSGINWRSTLKMKMSIVISTLENPETHGFRKSEFLSCAKPIMICPILRQMAAYILEFRSNSEK
ncbi:hypothetical protein PRIPAC_91478 [Pristionchus pacificus]|uniref:Uncharacterized protein n=1 Tax=Pristionchus pacificus TaxID=54126 RepID=A0A2A6BW15_PRIPA|nr:hypothetical protein PRIPAC_91478 [Pristionchus pacificus]|eukprot:PDM70202.1 hypothetical protein PRIPAC_45553 [Pristionchus pacificus]